MNINITNEAQTRLSELLTKSTYEEPALRLYVSGIG
jgi:Fe-S cluster assembly iron-binding protein IscA